MKPSALHRRSVVTGAMLLLLTGTITTAAAQSKTPWPGVQSSLQPGESTAKIKVELPADVKVVAPGNDVPGELAKFSGTWTGWLGRQKEYSIKFAVEQLTTGGGTVTYVSFGPDMRTPYTTRVPAKWENSELWGSFQGGAWFATRLRPDGHMDFMWNYGKGWAVGVLARD